ncbi:MAG TPA: hypothetical protein DC057_15570 [Spirochaetia bacterium]|nr:hypothetical protein [Spirochaetia bacterium]
MCMYIRKDILFIILLTIFTCFFLVSAYSFPVATSFTDAYKKAQAGQNPEERVYYWEQAQKLYTSQYKTTYLETVHKMLAYGYYELSQPFFNEYKNNITDVHAYKSAEMYLKKSVEVNSPYFYPENWLWSLFEIAGNFETALGYYSERINVYPKRPHAYFFRAKCLVSLNREEKNIEEDFNRSILLFNNLIDSGTLSDDLIQSAKQNIIKALQTLCTLHLQKYNFPELYEKSSLLLQYTSDYSNYETAFIAFQVLMLQELTAYANGHYAEAIKYHEAAAEIVTQNSKIATMANKNNYFNNRLDLIQVHAKLQKNTSAIIHTILVQPISKTIIHEVDYHITGKLIKIQTEITAHMLELAQIRHQVMKKDIEAMSNGALSLDFTYSDEPLQVDSVEYWYYNGKTMISPDISKAQIQAKPEFWYDTVKNFDSVLFYWNSGSISPVSTGGVMSSPYDKTAIRGRVSIPLNKLLSDWHNTLLLHEFFHIVEYRYNLSPVHAYLQEIHTVGFDYIPGNEAGRISKEIEYYWHAFKDITGKNNWENLSFIQNYPEPQYNTTLINSKSQLNREYSEGLSDREYKQSYNAVLSRIPEKVQEINVPTSGQSAQFVFFSDAHVESENHPVLKVFPSFITEKDDFIISGGDNVVDSRIEKQQNAFLTLMKTINLPYYSAIGNHDAFGDPKAFQFIQEFKNTIQILHAGDVDILFIDSASGILSDEQIHLIHDTLQLNPGAIIVSHVNFFSESGAGKPQMIVNEKRALLKIFKQYNVPLVLTGHSHQLYDITVEGIRFLGVPDFYSQRATFFRVFKRNNAFFVDIIPVKSGK